MFVNTACNYNGLLHFKTYWLAIALNRPGNFFLLFLFYVFSSLNNHHHHHTYNNCYQPAHTCFHWSKELLLLCLNWAVTLSPTEQSRAQHSTAQWFLASERHTLISKYQIENWNCYYSYYFSGIGAPKPVKECTIVINGEQWENYNYYFWTSRNFLFFDKIMFTHQIVYINYRQGRVWWNKVQFGYPSWDPKSTVRPKPLFSSLEEDPKK